MFMGRQRLAHCCSAIAVLAAVAAVPDRQADAADGFAGKQIRLIVPAGPAGGYGLYGQLLAEHLGDFIPGHPAVVVSFMPGASGLVAMNYLYEIAPHDGTVMAVITQDLPTRQVLGRDGVRYDATKFNYIGRATANVPVHILWHTAPAKSIDDLKTNEVVTGAVGSAGSQSDLPRASNALIGTKWKIVGGYKGNNETRTAMERGETQAAIAPATLFEKQLKPWLDQGKVKVIIQYADFRHPAFPEVPTLVELTKTTEAKGIARLLVSLATVGRAYALPPGVQADTVDVLRKAFNTMMEDPAFRADAKKRGADLMPMSGEALGAYIKEIVATPSGLVKETHEIIAAH
jgi:tripartite-type tricarboxylate transporter receptor subunit TctC